MNTEKTTETTGPQQLRPVYYEPTHKPWDEKSIRLALKLRGYQITRDTSRLDEPGLAVLRDGDGQLQVANGAMTEPLPEMEEYVSPGVYATAIADWFDGGLLLETDCDREPHYHLTSPLSEQAADLHFYVGAWADRPPVDNLAPSGTYFHGCRGKAVDTIDQMLEQLHELRSQLVQEGRRYEDELMAHLDAKYGKPADEPSAAVDVARAELAAAERPDVDDLEEDFCNAPVRVTMAVTDGRDVVFSWSCLQHADEFATELESEFGMVPARSARLTPTALCGHQGRQSLVSVAVPDEGDEAYERECGGYAFEVDMDAVRAFNRGGVSW